MANTIFDRYVDNKREQKQIQQQIDIKTPQYNSVKGSIMHSVTTEDVEQYQVLDAQLTELHTDKVKLETEEQQLEDKIFKFFEDHPHLIQVVHKTSLGSSIAIQVDGNDILMTSVAN